MSRIDSGTILVAFFAILFGLAGAFLLRKSLRPQTVVRPPAQVVRSAPTKITVPLASRALKAGTQITLDDIALFRLTRDEMKEHGIKRVFMSNPDQIIGKTVAADLKRGSTFDTKDFYAPGTGPGITSKLAPGQRAVTVEIDATSALIGFAGAGQSVDVLFHFGKDTRSADSYSGTAGRSDVARGDVDATGAWRPPHIDYNPPRSYNGYASDYEHQNRWRRGVGKKFQSATVTLVQKATILALGQRVNQDGTSSRLGDAQRVRVTLAVAPESAELIRVAEGHGELSLTLRGEGDEEIVDLTEPKVLSNIIDMGSDDVVIVRPEVREMDIYRGQSRSRVQFLRDRNVGKDDFQTWVVATPATSKSDSRQSQSDQSDQAAKADPAFNESQTAPAKIEPPRNGYSNQKQPRGSSTRLIEGRQWSAQQRLQSDFRKIRTLFNRDPDSSGRRNGTQPVNLHTPSPNQSDNLSSDAASGEPRSANVVELYNPRSWK